MAGPVKLSLYIGPGVPIAAPQEVLELLSSAKVMSGAGESQSGFELSFDLPPRSPLRTLFLLTGGGNLPLMRVVLVVTINGQAESIIDGMTTDVEMQPGEGGVGKLVVKGKDMSALMDVIDFTGLPYPAMPPAARVLILLAKYAAVGVIPLVIPSIVEDIPIPVQRIPSQKGSDYKYIQKLARQCGYVFYLEPGPAPGSSKAYWGPEVRVGAPQPALSMNMDALTNVEELSFNFDREKKIMPVVFLIAFCNLSRPSPKKPSCSRVRPRRIESVPMVWARALAVSGSLSCFTSSVALAMLSMSRISEPKKRATSTWRPALRAKMGSPPLRTSVTVPVPNFFETSSAIRMRWRVKR